MGYIIFPKKFPKLKEKSLYLVINEEFVLRFNRWMFGLKNKIFIDFSFNFISYGQQALKIADEFVANLDYVPQVSLTDGILTIPSQFFTEHVIQMDNESFSIQFCLHQY